MRGGKDLRRAPGAGQKDRPMSHKSVCNKFFAGALLLSLSRCVAAPSGAYGNDYAPYGGGYYGGPVIGSWWGWGDHGDEGHEDHGDEGHEGHGGDQD
jgi:hypothetical protein